MGKNSKKEKMQERLRAFWEQPENRGRLSNEDGTLAFAEAEVRLALAPKERESEGLTSEGASARLVQGFEQFEHAKQQAEAARQDNDRLRASVARLETENARLKDFARKVKGASLNCGMLDELDTCVGEAIRELEEAEKVT